MKYTRSLTVALAATFLVAGCGAANEMAGPPPAASPSSTAGPTSSDPESFPTPDPADLEPTTQEPADELSVAKYGETGSFTQDDGTFTVQVNKPTKGKCQYSSIGCDKPETGDRVITTKVVIKNTGKEATEVSPSMFALEFADGTRMDASDGAASNYSPDNAMDYSHTIRPGGTYTSTLTFEAPNGPFQIIMLSNAFGGEDLYAWK